MLLSQEEVCPAAVSPSAVLREQEMRAVSLRETHIEWAQRARLSTAVSDFCDAGRSVPICDSPSPKNLCAEHGKASEPKVVVIEKVELEVGAVPHAASPGALESFRPQGLRNGITTCDVLVRSGD